MNESNITDKAAHYISMSQYLKLRTLKMASCNLTDKAVGYLSNGK